MTDREEILKGIERAFEAGDAPTALREIRKLFASDEVTFSDDLSEEKEVLLADDDESFREIIQMVLEENGYSVSVAKNGNEAVEMARRKKFDVAVCDVRMPEKSGIEAIKEIKELQPGVRPIVVTGYASKETPVEALKLGVKDYLHKPFETRDFLHSVELQVSQAREERDRAKKLEKLADQYLEALKDIALDLERRSHWFAGHSLRVSRLALRMAQDLGLEASQVRDLTLAAMLHDLGHLDIPERILSKPGALSAEEWQKVKQSMGKASRLLRPLEALAGVGVVIEQIRERHNGSGYPARLAGEAVSVEARIIGTAEVFDSMTSPRPWRPPRAVDEAIRHITENRDGLYEGAVADALLRAAKIR
jgi:putative two-component system response regulator